MKLFPGMIVYLNDVDYRIKDVTNDYILAVPVEWDDERLFGDDYIEVGTPDRYTHDDFADAVIIA